ncbi:MAG: hypothetical protein KOO65_08070 [Desulfobacterales bacterium]|nr:hypothetical protein [Desulfobacterales bacterium]
MLVPISLQTMGQMFLNVKATLEVSEKVVLANRMDEQIITPENINMVLKAVQGKGL